MADVTISELNNITPTGNLVLPASNNLNTGKVSIDGVIDTVGLRSTSFNLPAGTTTQRPISPSAGTIRWNTTNSYLEYFNGTSWVSLSPLSSLVEVLVVGGGGSGGGNVQDGNQRIGGGGAGGYLHTTISLIANTSYTVIVGAGGATAIGDTANTGSNSRFDTLIASGGGGGAGCNFSAQKNGSSGGGGSSCDTSGGVGTNGQGNNGANSSGYNGFGGGGGGAGSSGNNANGGSGIFNSITGTSTAYAGGGGGSLGGLGGSGIGGNGTSSSGIAGGTGTTNTGSGGGGGFASSGGAGGSGIVVVAYPGTASRATITGVGANTSTSIRSGYVVHRFLSTGTSTFTWNG